MVLTVAVNYAREMATELDTKFRKPGITSLVTGVVLFVAKGVLGAIPLIGGVLGFVAFWAGLLFIAGGIFLLISKRSN